MMETSCVQFIEKLMKTSDFLQNIGQKTHEYWAPDPPPVTILFAAIGKELARQFDSIADENKEIAFRYIEQGMNSNDNALKTAVAAGIIEALISESDRIEGLWSRIEMRLGDASKRHAESWRNAS